MIRIPSRALILSSVLVPVILGAALSCGDDDGRERFDPADASGAGTEAMVPAADSGPITACEEAARDRTPLGCAYYAFAVGDSVSHLCTAVLLSNPGVSPATVSISLRGKSLAIHGSLRLLQGVGEDPGWAEPKGDAIPPGGSAVVALVDGAATLGGDGHCPFPALSDGSIELTEEGTRDAFRIDTSEPLFATYFFKYASAATGLVDDTTASASLRALPSWGAVYLDVGMYAPGRPKIEVDRTGQYPSGNMRAFAAVVAPTTANVVLGGDDGGVTTLKLGPGEVHRFIRDDLFIGTSITSDTPIGLFVGAGIAFIPYNDAAGDQILTPVPPVEQWASEIVALPHPPRRPGADDPALFRIIAKTDGTVLTYDPALPPGAPTTLAAGGLGVFRSSFPFVVRSQDAAHPIFVSVAMTGSAPLCETLDGGPDNVGFPPEYGHCPGDPELAMVPPPAEYARSFAFTTEHEFADDYLVIVRKKGDAGLFADVTLDCAGTLEGWQSVDAQHQYESLVVTLSKGNFAPQAYPGGTCRLGAHVMSSALPFSGFVWGWSHEGVDGLAEGDDGGGRSYGFALYGINPTTSPH